MGEGDSLLFFHQGQPQAPVPDSIAPAGQISGEEIGDVKLFNKGLQREAERVRVARENHHFNSKQVNVQLYLVSVDTMGFYRIWIKASVSQSHPLIPLNHPSLLLFSSPTAANI
jgi:hypothetical protein